jgi:hypothetical protein
LKKLPINLKQKWTKSSAKLIAGPSRGEKPSLWPEDSAYTTPLSVKVIL